MIRGCHWEILMRNYENHSKRERERERKRLQLEGFVVLEMRLRKQQRV